MRQRGLSQRISRNQLQPPETPFFWAARLRCASHSVCLRCIDGLRLAGFIQALSYNHLLYGESGKPEPRLQQHAELGDDRSDRYRHHAGYIHVYLGKRFNNSEPDGDDHLHIDCDKYSRLGYIHSYRHGKRAEQADH